MRRRSLRTCLFLGAATCLVASLLMFPLSSWGDRDVSRLCALQLILNARKLGYKVRNGDFGELKEGKTQDYQGLFYRGSSYMVVACGDEGVKNLDLRLYQAPKGKLVAQDDTKDRTPTLIFTPKKSGVYVLRAIMQKGNGTFTIATLYK